MTRAVVQTSLNYFLKVDARVTKAVLSLHGLSAEGTVNLNDTFKLNAKPHNLTGATVTLHYDGNVNTFSNVATVELPRIATVLDATFTTENRLLELNATLLEGSLNGQLSLQDWDYHYEISNVDLTSYLSQQRPPFPNYATGQLSAEGSGIIETPYTVDFVLHSHQLQLEENTTTLISAELEHPLALNIDINGSINTNSLTSKLTLQSALIDLDIRKLFYDFNRSQFSVALDMVNHDKETVPLNNASLDLNGTVGSKNLYARFQLRADDYELKTNKLRYNFNANALTLDYRLNSQGQKPLNLQGDNTLFGDISYTQSTLEARINSKTINSPILLNFKDNRLHLISTNISLKPLQTMVNQEVIVQGNATVEVDADMNSSPVLWQAHAESENLQLPLKYRKDLGLKNDLSVTVKANSEQNGDIVVRPTLWSNIGVVNSTALRYSPSSELMYFNLNAKKVHTAYFSAHLLNIKGSLNLQKSRLNKTTLSTPDEQIVINDLLYSDDNVKSHLHFALSRLDRYASLNPDYNLTGSAFVNYSPEKTTLKLNSKEFGPLTIEQKNKVLKVTAKALPIEQVMRLSDQPVIMRGDLALELRHSPSSITAKATSKQISGYGDLNSSIRPFPLSFTTVLKHKKELFQGQASVNTANESFTLSNLTLDLSKETLKSRFILAIDALEKNTFILPKALKGPLLVNGSFEQNDVQYLSLNIVGFQLPAEWHKKLDKNATSHLDTNASLKAYNDKGLISFDSSVTNRLLHLKLEQSAYNLKTGAFHLNAALQTDLWLKDTNLTTAGTYKDKQLTLPAADLDTAHMHATMHTLSYGLQEQNLTSDYKLKLKEYAGAPYRGTGVLEGHIRTKPKLYATLNSTTLGGLLESSITDKKLHIRAEDLSVVKLIAFSGKELPVTSGRLNAKIDVHSPALFDTNRSELKGYSDIKIDDLMLNGITLDASLKALRESQDLNLFQGSLMELPIIRSIKNIPKELTTKKVDHTHFQEMRFLTDINDSMLHCKDCAVATDANLIAAQGDVNLSSRTFDAFYVGLLFPNNCAYFIQQIKGNLSKPKVQLAAAGFHVISGATQSLIGNIGGALNLGADIVKGTGTFVGNAASYVPIVGERTDKLVTKVTDAPKRLSTSATECIPFYSGSIQHPETLNVK